MNFLERRRMLLAGESLLPFVIWQQGWADLTQIPVNYTLTRATLTIVGGSLSISGQSGPGTKSVSFVIPAKICKKAKQLNITWYVLSAYGSCSVKIECDGQTLTDNATSNNQTRIYNPDISSMQGDMTITFAGSGVRIYTFIVSK